MKKREEKRKACRNSALMKCLSVLMIAALTVTAVMTVPLYPSAAVSAGGDPGNVSTVGFGSGNTLNKVIYNDELFTTDSSVYDPQLAVMSIALASAACNTYRCDESTKYTLMSRNAYEYLEDNGFSDIYVNEDFKVKPDGTKAPALFARKKIVDNGKEYTLLALVPKSGAMGAEYYNIAKASARRNDKDDFAYLAEIRDKTLKSARNYIRDYGIKGDVKLWIPGYSRGGGVATLMASKIIDDPGASLGSSVNVSGKDIYCYSLSTYRVGDASKDLHNDRYSCIHNIVSDTDIVIKLPWEFMCFWWYGNVYDISSLSEKDDALRLLKTNEKNDYESFISGGDPDSFSPMKLDLKALLGGKVSMAKDDASYLPNNQADFLDAVMTSAAEIFAEGGGDVRNGYYTNYQEPLIRFTKYYIIYGMPGTSDLLKSKTAIPFVLSEYLSILVEKSAENGDIDNAKLNAAVQDAFNALAYVVEDKNGNFRKEFDSKKLKEVKTYYNLIKWLCFEKNTDADTEVSSIGIPQRYRLTMEFKFDSMLLQGVRKLSTRLYALTMNDILTAQGVDSDTVSKMTSDKDSAAMSALLAHFLLEDAAQPGEIRPLSPENEQFKHLATLIGNFSSYDTFHYVETDMSWIEAGCGLYDDFEGLTDDQKAGYRRVFIDPAETVDVNGTVRDGNGNIVAGFRNGKILSRTDPWIGYTVSDNGGWLRLPLNSSYTVELKVSADTGLDMRLSEYSRDAGKEVRTVKWTGIKAYKNGSITMSVPEISAGESGYSLPSDVKYSVSKSGSEEGGSSADPAKTKYSKSVPKVKNVRVKAASKSMTVSWRKLSAGQRKKFSKVELQYSASKKFKKYTTLDVSKNRKSVKITGLKKGRTYYVRVRNVKKKGGIRYVSKWSAKKKARIR